MKTARILLFVLALSSPGFSAIPGVAIDGNGSTFFSVLPGQASKNTVVNVALTCPASALPCSQVLTNEGPGGLWFLLDEKTTAPSAMLTPGTVQGTYLSPSASVMYPVGAGWVLHYRTDSASNVLWTQSRVSGQVGPTPYVAPTFSSTMTPTRTATPVSTATPVWTATVTKTSTKTITPTITKTMTPTRTITPTMTATISPTSTKTP